MALPDEINESRLFTATLPTAAHRWTASILNTYLQRYPEEQNGLQPLFQALQEQQDLTWRKSFPLHSTGSTMVLDLSGTHLLLVLHRRLRMWLPPGGHLEKGELPYAAAVRELAEECGVTDIFPVAGTYPDGEPLDVDVHPIPANSAKREPAHYHCDFTYLFCADMERPIRSPENRAVRWVRLDDSENEQGGGRLQRLARKAIGRLR
jgi:8-oxo-dGTP pyrophosphatase MutT (NUDIX family)